MEVIKSGYLQDDYLGQKTAETLAIDYDENQLLVKELSDRRYQPRREELLNVK